MNRRNLLQLIWCCVFAPPSKLQNNADKWWEEKDFTHYYSNDQRVVEYKGTRYEWPQNRMIVLQDKTKRMTIAQSVCLNNTKYKIVSGLIDDKIEKFLLYASDKNNVYIHVFQIENTTDCYAVYVANKKLDITTVFHDCVQEVSGETGS